MLGSTADSNGIARFTDTSAPGYPHRFYRLVSPRRPLPSWRRRAGEKPKAAVAPGGATLIIKYLRRGDLRRSPTAGTVMVIADYYETNVSLVL